MSSCTRNTGNHAWPLEAPVNCYYCRHCFPIVVTSCGPLSYPPARAVALGSCEKQAGRPPQLQASARRVCRAPSRQSVSS